MQSTDIIQPVPLISPIATEGLKNSIPDAATGTNNASIEEGFPGITMQAPANGGLPPFGQDFNGLFYMVSSLNCFLQNGGYITFSQAVSDKIGGYPNGAILDYIDSTGAYSKVQSLIDNNTNNFVTTPSFIDGVNWKQLEVSLAAVNLTQVGDPIITLSNILGENEIWLEGAEVSKTTYSALYAVYGDTYGTAESEDNFVLPDFRGRVLWGAGSDDNFGYIEAGLPNITGTIQANCSSVTLDAKGAFQNSRIEGSTRPASSSGAGDWYINYSAANSNPIYGNSTTVQPPSVKVRVKTRFA